MILIVGWVAARADVFTLSPGMCAKTLLGRTADFAPPARLDDAERALIAAVPETIDGINAFFRTIFPKVDLRGPYGYQVCFGALWRRFPELRPPAFGTDRSPARILAHWRAFKAEVERAPRPVRGVNTPKHAIAFDPEIQRHLAKLTAAELAEIEALPWEGRAITEYLRLRYPEFKRRPLGSADRYFHLLWEDLFGVKRPWNVTLPRDGHDNYPRRLHVGAPHRVLEEWRVFRMMLNVHLPSHLAARR